MKLCDVYPRKAILLDLKSRDAKGVVKELAAALRKAAPGSKPTAAALANAVLARESKSGSSGLGHGVAIPHAEIAGLKDVVGAFGRTSSPIDFSAIDGHPVDVFFMVCSPPSKREEYREVLGLLSRAIHGPNVLKFLRAAKQPKDVEEVLREADAPAAATHA